MLKAKELRDQALEELEANCRDKRAQLFKLRNERRQNRDFEKPHRIQETKKEIAQLLTVIHEKQLQAKSLD